MWDLPSARLFVTGLFAKAHNKQSSWEHRGWFCLISLKIFKDVTASMGFWYLNNFSI